MEAGVLVSAVVAVVIPALTYWLTKRREHEAAWRELKLKRYQEYMAALSAVVGDRTNSETRARYADAANTLSLVAPPAVLRALYQFHDEISLRGSARSRERHDAKLTALMKAMRADAQGRLATAEDDQVSFRLVAAGPSTDPDAAVSDELNADVDPGVLGVARSRPPSGRE